MLPAEPFAPKPLDMSNEHLATEETNTEPTHVHIKTEGSDIMDQVHSCTSQDELVMHTLKELSSGANLQRGKWEECDGPVLSRGKVYSLLDTQLWHDIVEAHHDTLVTGHSEWWKMTELVVHDYWWPGMVPYIAKYVKGCDLCNKDISNSPSGKTHAQPHPIPSVADYLGQPDHGTPPKSHL